MSDRNITRFAPSPTGPLHLGHAYAALFAAQAAGPDGRFLLRIDDLDPGRSRPAFLAGIVADLAWLGLDWPEPVRFQSAHLSGYRAALDQLTGLGLTYPCFCTRKDVQLAATAPHAGQEKNDSRYPGRCRSLSAAAAARAIAGGRPHALRLAIDRAAARAGPGLAFEDRAIGRVEADPRAFGDIVLARKDVPASYHLAVTVDDAAQGVTLVTRGIDLLPATAIHRLLQALLGLPTPRYHHHRLILDASGRRLAKRDGATALAVLRARDISADAIRRQLGFAPARAAAGG